MSNFCVLLASPILPSEDLDRLRAMFAQVGDGDGFVGVYSRTACVVVVATVIAGAVTHWMAFPAANDADAHRLAQQAKLMSDRLYDASFKESVAVLQQHRP